MNLCDEGIADAAIRETAGQVESAVRIRRRFHDHHPQAIRADEHNETNFKALFCQR